MPLNPNFSGGAPLWSRFVNPSDREERRPAPRGWVLPNGVERLPPPLGAAADCQLPYDWDRRGYAALDVETTGLDAFRDRVIEVGIVLFSYDAEGALIEEKAWGSLVNPGMTIPASSTAIHGITDLDVWASPYFRDLADAVSEFLDGRVMVAHNAPFDAGFISEEFSRLGLRAPLGEIADSLVLLRQAIPNLLSYSLGKAAYVLGVDTGTSHRALDDARTCMRLFTQCARKLAGTCP
ncbi:MAG TPA: 3'-5' exonuclease [Rectinemataceae bacterium]|nr:3'-5' exonuclease [Rectinemataceae bacterium]